MSLTTRFARPGKHAVWNWRPIRTARRDTTQLFLEILERRTLLDVGLSVGANVLVRPKPGNQSETSIAINPSNPFNLFAVANDAGAGPLFANYSIDGGVTWTPSAVTGLPSTSLRSDAQTAWDSFGNLFVTYLNNAGNAIITIMSSDGGQTFSVINMTSGNNIDQPSIAVGPSNAGDGTGSVWVSYEDVNANFGQGAISVKGAVVAGLGIVTPFSAAKRAPGSGKPAPQFEPGDFGNVAVGPNGQVLVVYELPSNTAGPAELYVNLDAHGLSGDFGPPVLVTNTNVGGFTPITPQPSRTVDAGVRLAYDRSGGPNTGRVYMVYTDRASVADMDDTNIYERYSDDDGATWSERILVNEDGPTRKAHFNPAIAVDQSLGTSTSGFLALTWYDSRDSPLNNSAEVWGTISIDGGQTFLPNVQISTGLINAHASDPAFEFGDYDTMDFHQGTFYRTWTDNTLPGHNVLDLATAPATVVFSDSPVPKPRPHPRLISLAALAPGNDRGTPQPIGHARVQTTSIAQAVAPLSQSVVLSSSAATPATEALPVFLDVACLDPFFANPIEEAQEFPSFQSMLAIEMRLLDGLVEVLGRGTTFVDWSSVTLARN